MGNDAPLTTGKLLQQRLGLAYAWYQGMVNPSTEMFEYTYVPETDTYIRARSPIRDIASIWNAEILSRFLSRQGLQRTIERSLRHYCDCLVDRDGYMIVDPERLGEPSSIAHSAFLILAALHAPRREAKVASALAEGILQQQRPDGSYKVHFHDLPDYGEDLYAGEAMLALMEAFRESRDDRYLQSVARAFSFYATDYFGRGRVRTDVLAFFANWQSQACRLLFECASDVAIRRDVAAYLESMHDRIIDGGFYEDVERYPSRQVTVEVACALEGLNDTYSLAEALGTQRVDHYHRCICIALEYLLTVQCTSDGTHKEPGGFGMSLDERTQRIDVTGHAVSALMKSADNAIECSLRRSV